MSTVDDGKEIWDYQMEGCRKGCLKFFVVLGIAVAAFFGCKKIFNNNNTNSQPVDTTKFDTTRVDSVLKKKPIELRKNLDSSNVKILNWHNTPKYMGNRIFRY